MTRATNLFKRTVVVIALLLLIGAGFFTYFLHSNEAPVIEGKKDFDISYNENQSLDVYHPTGSLEKDKYPVLMYVHGGAWIVGSKFKVNNNRFTGAFSRLREQGYYIVSPEYTLARNGKTPFPDCIQDVFQAVDWVYKNAEEYQFDLNNFGIIGESAGSHLAMMVAFSAPATFELELEKRTLRYLIDIYGPTDLGVLYNSDFTDSINAIIKKLPSSLAKKVDISSILVGFDPKTDSIKAEEVMNRISPTYYLGGEDFPVLIIHGKADQIVPIQQSFLLKELLDSLKIPSKAFYFDGVNHAFAGASDAQKDSIQNLIYDFVIEYQF